MFLLLPAERRESADDLAEVGPDQSHCVGSTIAFLPELLHLKVVLTGSIQQCVAYGLFVSRKQAIECRFLLFSRQYGCIQTSFTNLTWPSQFNYLIYS